MRDNKEIKDKVLINWEVVSYLLILILHKIVWVMCLCFILIGLFSDKLGDNLDFKMCLVTLLGLMVVMKATRGFWVQLRFNGRVTEELNGNK